MRVGELMHRTDETVHPDHALDEAAARMERLGQPYLPVADGDEIVGVIAADDLGDAAGLAGGEKRALQVRDRMSTAFAFCYESDDVETARAAVAGRDDAVLCVTDSEGRLVGVVSREEIAAAGPGAPAARAPPRERRVSTPGRARPGAGGRPRGYEPKPTVKR